MFLKKNYDNRLYAVYFISYLPPSCFILSIFFVTRNFGILKKRKHFLPHTTAGADSVQKKKKLKSPTSWLVRQFSSSMVTQECHNFIVYDSCNVPSFLRPWLSRLSLLLVGRTTVSHWFDFNFKEHSCLLLSHLHHPWKRVLQTFFFKLTVVILEIWRPVYGSHVKRQAEHQGYKVRDCKVCDQKFIGW